MPSSVLIGPHYKHMPCMPDRMRRRAMAEGRAGDNVGLLLRGTKKDEVQRGQVGRGICKLAALRHFPGVPRRRT